jgi:hypothetical protein
LVKGGEWAEAGDEIRTGRGTKICSQTKEKSSNFFSVNQWADSIVFLRALGFAKESVDVQLARNNI